MWWFCLVTTVNTCKVQGHMAKNLAKNLCSGVYCEIVNVSLGQTEEHEMGMYPSIPFILYMEFRKSLGRSCFESNSNIQTHHSWPKRRF